MVQYVLKILQALSTLLPSLVSAYQNWKNKKRSDAIYAQPADEWLHKFGGKDARDTSAQVPKLDDNKHMELSNKRGNSD